MLANLTPPQLGLLIALVGVLAGWGLATWLGRQDRRTCILRNWFSNNGGFHLNFLQFICNGCHMAR